MRIALIVLITLSLCALALAQQPAPAANAGLPDGVRLPAELNHTVDAKKAKVGDAVKMEVLASLLNLKKEVVIPKGAVLTGKVVEAVAHSKENPESRLAILVENAEWKGGSMPLHAYIESPIGGHRPNGGPGVDTSGGGGRVGGASGDALSGNFPHPREGSAQLGPLVSSWEDVEIKTLDGKPVLVCAKHNVTLGTGTRFVLKQITK